MKTEKSIQFLSNNRKLIAGPCKKQFFLSFYLFYYIHTPVPPLSQANQSDGNRVAREVGFDHHLTTSSPQPVPLIVCTLQHSFITTTTSAGSCARCTISGAVSLYLPVCHSSPTRLLRSTKLWTTVSQTAKLNKTKKRTNLRLLSQGFEYKEKIVPPCNAGVLQFFFEEL